MYILFSEISEKEVINCSDGASLGFISDIEISTDECRITTFIIKNNNGLFCKNTEIRIPYSKVEKIGKDVIIVNYCPADLPKNCCENKKRTLFGKL